MPREESFFEPVLTPYAERPFVANLDPDNKAEPDGKLKFYPKKEGKIKNFWRIPAAKEVLGLDTGIALIRENELYGKLFEEPEDFGINDQKSIILGKLPFLLLTEDP